MAKNNNNPNYRFDTKKVRAGYNPLENNFAISPPIYQTTAYEFDNVETARDLIGFRKEGFIYTRIGNPTVAVLEQRVAALDGAAAAIAVGSGMAAITFTLLTLAEGGGTILVSPYLYGGTVDSFKKIYPKFGIKIETIRNIENPESIAEQITAETKAIFVESISNPNAYLVDLDAIAETAHAHGVPVVVDNTVATPYLYNPIAHGADIVVYSATKGLNGHGNIIAGLVLESGRFDFHSDRYPQFSEKYYTLRDKAGNYRSILETIPAAPFTTRIRLNYLNYFGAALSPFDAYLVTLGLETLSERLAKQSHTAHTLAEYLNANEHVEWVRYPALESSPYHDLYRRDFPNGAGGLLSFSFKGTQEQIDAFLNATELFNYHANLGDARSLIINSPENTHGELEPEEKAVADIPNSLIRISAGLEDPADLIADLEQAFAKAFAGGKKAP